MKFSTIDWHFLQKRGERSRGEGEGEEEGGVGGKKSGREGGERESKHFCEI